MHNRVTMLEMHNRRVTIPEMHNSRVTVHWKCTSGFRQDHPGDPQPRARCRWSYAARVERHARRRRQGLGRASGAARPLNRRDAQARPLGRRRTDVGRKHLGRRCGGHLDHGR